MARLALAGAAVVSGFGGSRSPRPGLQGYDTVTQSPPWPIGSAEPRKLLSDALRLTLWRATGSAGAWLVPEQVARKRKACGI